MTNLTNSYVFPSYISFHDKLDTALTHSLKDEEIMLRDKNTVVCLSFMIIFDGNTIIYRILKNDIEFFEFDIILWNVLFMKLLMYFIIHQPG